MAYLIINWRVKDLADRVKLQPDRAFYEAVATHLNAYVQKGVMPPAEIAPAILNMADDYMAGRAMNLRAGDYIAIQNFLRRGK